MASSPSTAITSASAASSAIVLTASAASTPTHLQEKEKLASPFTDVRQQYVHEAICQMPDLEQSHGYRAAWRRAPHLVLNESNPVAFCEYCQGDFWKAAVRLCRYWNQRCHLFGDERAFCPMMLSGDGGALSFDDTICLHAGYPVLIVPSQSQPLESTNTRPVLWLDRRNWLPGNAESKLRCIFFILHILMQDPRSRDEQGIVLLSLISDRRMSSYNPAHVKRGLDLWSHTFPVRFSSNGLALLRYQRLKVVQDFILTGVASVMKQRGNSVQLHTEEKPGSLVEELQDKVGLELWQIPSDVGGEWTLDQFTQTWLAEQLEWERRTTASMDIKYDTAPTTSTTAEEGLTRMLEQETLNLQQEQERLRREQRRLEQMLQQAQDYQSMNMI